MNKVCHFSFHFFFYKSEIIKRCGKAIFKPHIQNFPIYLKKAVKRFHLYTKNKTINNEAFFCSDSKCDIKVRMAFRLNSWLAECNKIMKL